MGFYACQHADGGVWLLDEIVAARAQRLLQYRIITAAGKEDDGSAAIPVNRPDLRAQDGVVHSRQLNSEQESIDLKSIGECDYLLSRLRLDYLVAFRLEYSLQDVSIARIFVCDQDNACH